MAIGTEISRGRQLAAAGSLVAAGVGWLGVPHMGPRIGVGLTVVAFLAAALIGRRSVLAQILGRGAAWFGFILALTGTIAFYYPILAAITVATGAGLLLSVPLLHTEGARAEFAPARFRRTFLAAATSAVASATVAGGSGLAMLAYEPGAAWIAWLAIAAGFVGAAVGVVRMRAWGVMLGVLTSTAMLVAAAVMPTWREVLLVLAAPGALFALPVLLARLGLTLEDRAGPPAMRVSVAPAALRIAADAAPVEDGDLEATETGIERRLAR
jgi:hypothetical protein